MYEPLRISYGLVGTGWAECVVEANDGRVALSVSDLSDALGNLVLSAIAAASGYHSAEFGFDEEPSEYRWSLVAVDNNTIRLRIFEFEELWSHKPTESGRLLLETTLAPLAYAKAVLACAAAVQEEPGVAGYAEKWAEHPFPAHLRETLANSIARWEQ